MAFHNYVDFIEEWQSRRNKRHQQSPVDFLMSYHIVICLPVVGILQTYSHNIHAQRDFVCTEPSHKRPLVKT